MLFNQALLNFCLLLFCFRAILLVPIACLCCEFGVVDAPCKNKHKFYGREKCTHQVRITSTAKLKSPLSLQKHGASLPNVHESHTFSPRMRFFFDYSFDVSPMHIKAPYRSLISFALERDVMRRNTFQSSDYPTSELLKANQNKLEPSVLPHSCCFDYFTAKCSQSLPDLIGSDVTHRSTVLLEKYRLHESLSMSCEKVLFKLVIIFLLIRCSLI